MEKRTVEEVKIYMLFLNDMRSARIQNRSFVAIAFDKQKLSDWYDEQKAAEIYEDGQWRKTFKKDSYLEWFNPPFGNWQDYSYGHGVNEQWVSLDWINKQQENGILIIN